MFEDIQERRRASRVKERSRLTLLVAGCLLVGTGIFFAKTRGSTSQTADDDESTQLKKKLLGGIEAPPVDLAPLAEVRATGEATPDFEPKALEHVVATVQANRIQRAPDLRATPTEVEALDPRTAPGTLLEVTGVVRALDREERKLPGARNVLWAFALDDAQGGSVVVIHPGLEGERGPGDAFTRRSIPVPVVNGERVKVRGIYLQRRIGSIAAIALDGPTPVIVGREYRHEVPPGVPVAGIAGVDWDSVRDRELSETRDVESGAHYELLQWAQALGPAGVKAALASGEIPTSDWTQAQFSAWRKELESDTDLHTADPRLQTYAWRGKAFRLTGVLADWVPEEWDTIPPNMRGVDHRYGLWLLSDDYSNAALRFDSPFPLSTWPDAVESPRLRVRATGIFVQNYSYAPKGEHRATREFTVPYFVLIDLEPLPFPAAGPVLANPFFWAWVGLAVLGAAFFLVMSRVERKEAKVIEVRAKRARESAVKALTEKKARRAAEAAGPADASPSATPPPGTGSGTDDAAAPGPPA